MNVKLSVYSERDLFLNDAKRKTNRFIVMSFVAFLWAICGILSITYNVPTSNWSGLPANFQKTIHRMSPAEMNQVVRIQVEAYRENAHGQTQMKKDH